MLSKSSQSVADLLADQAGRPRTSARHLVDGSLLLFAVAAPLSGGGLALLPLALSLPVLVRQLQQRPRLMWPAASLIGATLISAALGVDKLDGLGHVVGLLLLAAVGLAGGHALASDTVLLRHRWLPAATASTAVMAAYAVYQHFGLHIARATGFGGFANRLGTLLVFFGFVGLGYLLTLPTRWRWISIPFGVLVLAGVGATMSRAAWVAVVVGAAVMAVRWGRKGVAMLLLVCVLVAGVGSLQPRWVGRWYSIFDLHDNLDRVTLWWTALRIFASSPLVGRGPGSFPQLQAAFMPDLAPARVPISSTPHSVLFGLAADTGLLGLAAFSWLLARAFGMAWTVWRYGDIFSVGLVASVVAIMVNDLFGQGFYAMEVASVMWIGLGLLDGMYTGHRDGIRRGISDER